MRVGQMEGVVPLLAFSISVAKEDLAQARAALDG